MGNGTFNDLSFGQPPEKKRKLSHKIKNGWFCGACTVENPDMDALKCYLCETPRTFQEKIRYPVVSPVVFEANNEHKNNQKVDNMENKEDENKEENGKQKENNSLTFITWNVWFNEELQILERLNGIGNIIKLHDADIVCLQEITPLILDIIQSMPWYKNGYSSTILPSHGFFAGLSYFNVIVTKHEFIRDSIQFKPFSNSSMGRHLIITPIKMGNGKIVHAATSHLESPVGTYQGGKKDKFSPERKEQLRYSVELLDKKEICSNNNVIFGGDMNWCRATKNNENDGDIKKFLNKNWTDCWFKLHPNDNGYTYDAKTNGMLSGYLQNRVDRILYKNNGELKLISCEMIGREAIPNVTYIKTFKRKNGDEQKILPVLPSDHYGLVAKFDFV